MKSILLILVATAAAVVAFDDSYAAFLLGSATGTAVGAVSLYRVAVNVERIRIGSIMADMFLLSYCGGAVITSFQSEVLSSGFDLTRDAGVSLTYLNLAQSYIMVVSAILYLISHFEPKIFSPNLFVDCNAAKDVM